MAGRKIGDRGRSKEPGPEATALHDLDRVRLPLFREMEELRKVETKAPREPAHLCCRRAKNQMRISPLEAGSIALAFRQSPALRAKLPAVLGRLRGELSRLDESTRRQNFDCPLLEGTRCLVHHQAKPIGCLAWNPGRSLSETGWEAFARRDRLNDRLHGPSWKLRVIPLWLKRVFAQELREG